MSGKPRVAVVGSINLDLVASVQRLPRPGETVTDAVLDRIPGGKGANQAVAAARLGADVRFIGAIGEDAFACEATQGLVEAGVDLDLHVKAAPTGIALIVVDAAGENEIVVVPGANRELLPKEVELGAVDAVLAQLEIPISVVASACRQTVGLFCLNAAPASRLPERLARDADLIIVNTHELESLGAEAKRRRVIVTLGSEGAVLFDGETEVARARPPTVTPVDGTAAGDAFCACVVVSLLQGREWEEVLRRATAAGAIAASRPGAQPSLPTTEEVDAILHA